MKSFKQWLEASTSTSSVAGFARPVMGVSRRIYPQMITFSSFDKKKKKKLKEGVIQRIGKLGDSPDPQEVANLLTPEMEQHIVTRINSPEEIANWPRPSMRRKIETAMDAIGQIGVKGVLRFLQELEPRVRRLF